MYRMQITNLRDGIGLRSMPTNRQKEAVWSSEIGAGMALLRPHLYRIEPERLEGCRVLDEGHPGGIEGTTR